MALDTGVIADNGRKQDRISLSVRDVELCAELMCHTVVKSKGCRVECHTCQVGSEVHSFSGEKIACHLVIVGAVEIVLADLSRLLGIEVGEGGCVGADVCLDRVSKYVHSRICGDACGNALDHLNVKDRLLGKKLLVNDGVLYILFGIGNDREGGYFATRSAGSGDSDEIWEVVGLDLACKLTDTLGKVDCGAASYGDDAGSLVLEKRGNALADCFNRRIGSNVGLDGIFNACSIKMLCNLFDKSARNDKRVGNYKSALIFKLSKA